MKYGKVQIDIKVHFFLNKSKRKNEQIFLSFKMDFLGLLVDLYTKLDL